MATSTQKVDALGARRGPCLLLQAQQGQCTAPLVVTPSGNALLLPCSIQLSPIQPTEGAILPRSSDPSSPPSEQTAQLLRQLHLPPPQKVCNLTQLRFHYSITGEMPRGLVKSFTGPQLITAQSSESKCSGKHWV